MSFDLISKRRFELDLRLLGYLRARAERQPNSRRVGPFVATFGEDDDNKYLNYAIPDDGADPSKREIASLISLFEERSLMPRLEYMTAAAPKLEARLLAAGFEQEARVPIMVRTPDVCVRDAVAEKLSIFVASTDEELEGAELSQADAYSSSSRGPGVLRRTILDGGVVVAARDLATGAIVGVGIATPPINGITEIAGIGVRAAFRRQGAAGAITALLARQVFAKGITLAWLTPGTSEAERIYARVGFAVASEALHIAR
jgi:ribosomal protein S18 acetylase RimI-like enzyme